MRVAALYDIHGNLPALEAVLGQAWGEGVEMIVVGGDVAAGAMPRQTIEQLMALPSGRAWFVCGNADRETVEAFDSGRRDVAAAPDPPARAVSFAAGQISLDQRDFLAAFPPTVVLEVDGLGPTLFCHGSPRSDEEIITRKTPDARLRGILAGVAERTVVCGHIHQQFDRHLDGQRIVNAGSVGVPYEGRPGAYWALLGPGVELRRTVYDLHAAAEEMRTAGFPDVDEMLGDSLLDPTSPEEVTDFFERQAGSATA